MPKPTVGDLSAPLSTAVRLSADLQTGQPPAPAGCKETGGGRGDIAKSLLLARRAGVHVDFHADRHFNDLRCFPGH